MRKLILFLCAAAAMVALASCSKTQVINTEAPQEIAFKAVAGAITKTGETALSSDVSLGVIAFLNNNGNMYFGNTEFSKKNNDREWTSPSGDKKYWPFSNNLDFVVYSPYQGNVTYNSTDGFTIQVSNPSGYNQTDYLYGENYYDDSDDNGYSKESVPVILKHAMAKVTVNFTLSNVTLNDLFINQSYAQGSFNVKYDSNDNATLTWTVASDNNTYRRSFFTQNSTNNSYEVLVLPTTTSDIIFNYTLSGTSLILSHTIDLNTSWQPGTNYIYNVTISPQEIKVDPKVTNWNNQDHNGITIQ